MLVTLRTACNWFEPRRLSLSSLGLGIVAICLIGRVSAEPRKVETQKLQGKIAAVEKKGRHTVLKLEIEGEESREVLVTERTRIAIRMQGETQLLKPGEIVSTELTQTQVGDLVATKFTIHRGVHPAPSVKKDPRNPNSMEATGRITGIQPVVLSSDVILVMNFGMFGTRQVVVSGVPRVEVVSSHPTALTTGLEVHVESAKDPQQKVLTALTISGELLKGGNSTVKGDKPTSKSGNTSKPPTEKTSPETKESKGPKPKTSKEKVQKSKSKPADGKQADPFGVLKKD